MSVSWIFPPATCPAISLLTAAAPPAPLRTRPACLEPRSRIPCLLDIRARLAATADQMTLGGPARARYSPQTDGKHGGCGRSAQMTYQYIEYETLADGAIARITLNRPSARNAQNRGLLVELDEAFGAAEADDTVRVVILAGAGPLFSSGHDLGSKEALAEREPGPDQHPTMRSNGATRQGAEQRMLQEWHYFF